MVPAVIGSPVVVISTGGRAIDCRAIAGRVIGRRAVTVCGGPGPVAARRVAPISPRGAPGALATRGVAAFGTGCTPGAAAARRMAAVGTSATPGPTTT